MNVSGTTPPPMRFVVCDENEEVGFCCPRCGAKDVRMYAVDVDDGRVRVVMAEEQNWLKPARASHITLTPPRDLRVVMHFVCGASHDFFYQFRGRDRRTFVALDVEVAAPKGDADDGAKEPA